MYVTRGTLLYVHTITYNNISVNRTGVSLAKNLVKAYSKRTQNVLKTYSYSYSKKNWGVEVVLILILKKNFGLE